MADSSPCSSTSLTRHTCHLVAGTSKMLAKKDKHILFIFFILGDVMKAVHHHCTFPYEDVFLLVRHPYYRRLVSHSYRLSTYCLQTDDGKRRNYAYDRKNGDLAVK